MYHKEEIDRLEREAGGRYLRLMGSLVGERTMYNGKEFVLVNPSKVRLAVDDFENILHEFRRLK